MGTLPESHIQQFNEAYKDASIKLTQEFAKEFCGSDGSVDWDKLVKFNSGE